MRTSSRVPSQDRSLPNVLLIILAVLLALWPAGRVAGQTVMPSPNPLVVPYAQMGNSSYTYLTLVNPTNQQILITDIHVRGVQSQAGFLNTIAGVPPGNPPGTDPSTLPQGNTLAAGTVQFSDPEALMTGMNGQYFIADTGHNVILLYDSRTGLISRFAGMGTAGGTGDGGNALNALLNGPRALTRDHNINLYIADTGNYRVRMVQWAGGANPAGNISTLAGNGSPCTDPTDPCGDGNSAVAARLGTVLGVTHLTDDSLLISDMDACRVRRVNPTDGNIYLFAGDGKCEYSGDGGLAINAGLNHPEGIYGDQLGNVFIADTGNNVVRRIDAITGIIPTFAGNGSSSYGGDFQPANSVGLPGPRALYVDYLGNLFIACGDNTIRKVNVSTGVISTIAGTTSSGYNGDTIAALTQLTNPQGIATDFAGNLLIGDSGNNLLRRVDFNTLNTASEFTLLTDCTGSIDAYGSCPVEVAFAPALPNVRLANLSITQSGQSPILVPMIGLGLFTYARIAPSMALSVEALAGQSSNPLTVFFANSGNVPMQMTSVSLTGNSPGDFVETDNCAGSVNAYSHCTAQVTFNAPLGATSPSQANLEFVGDAMNGTQDVVLTGNSVVQQPTVLTWNPPAAIVYGTPLGSKQLNATANGPGIFTYNYAAGTVLSAGVQTLNVSFTPTDPLRFTSATASVSVQVNKAPLTVTPNNVTISQTAAIPSPLLGTITGIVNGDSLPVTYSTNATPGVVGVYNITATPNGNLALWNNYQAVFNVGKLTIGTPLPDLTVTSLSVPNPVTAGATVNVVDTTSNIGVASAGSTTTAYYLSTSSTTNNRWMYLGNRAVGALIMGASDTPQNGTPVAFPATITGTYWFFACANASGNVAESNTSNNCKSTGTAGITISTGVDLFISGLSYSPNPPTLGGQLQITDTIINQGTGTSGSSTTTYWLATFTTTGALLNAKWLYLGSRYVGPLSPTSPPTATTATTTVTLPTFLNGTYGVTACANAYKSALENNYNNNCTTTMAPMLFKLP